MSGKLVGVELTYRAAFHQTLHSHTGVACNPGIAQILIAYRISCVGKFLYAVAVVREIERSRPLPVLILNGNGVDGKLNASVADIAHVGSHCTEGVSVGRYWIIIYKVGRALVVIFDCTCESRVEESEVYADVEHAGALPFKVGVGVVGGCKRVLVGCHSVGVDVCEPSAHAVCASCRVCIEAERVARHAVADAQFEVGEDAEVAHPFLFANAPSCRKRGECSPTVVPAECRRTVAAQCCLEIVARSERVVDASVERNHSKCRLGTALYGVNAVNLVGVCEVVVLHGIVVEVLNGKSETVVLVVLLPRIAQHDAQSMITGEAVCEVAEGFEHLFVVHICRTCGLTVCLHNLRLDRVILRQNVLVVQIRVLCGPGEVGQDGEFALSGELHASVDVLIGIFVDHRERIVVLGCAG